MTEQTKLNIKKVIVCHALLMLPIVFQLTILLINKAVFSGGPDLEYSEIFMFSFLYFIVFYLSMLVLRPIYGFIVTVLSWKWKYILSIMFKPIVINTEVWSKIPRFLSVPLGILFYAQCLIIPIIAGFFAAFIGG